MLTLPNKIDAEIARLLRELALRDWARGCLRKRRFASQQQAWKQGRRSIRTRGLQMHAYYCKHCHGWHLTSRARIAEAV